MGGSSSKIQTLNVGTHYIRGSSPVEQGRFCPPFRKFKNNKVSIQNKRIDAILQIEEPVPERIAVTQDFYQDLQEAFEFKTKQIQLQSVLIDDQYVDFKTYLASQRGKDLTLQLRSFLNVNSYTFSNILYEIHLNEQIAKLNCPQLNTMIDKYAIETGLEVQGQQNPNTQVYILSPIATNLSEIIKYRRQNKWQWTTNQFNALAFDLSTALCALHTAHISHNDIRPCNVYYSLEKNCYQLGNFANAVKSNSIDSARGSINQLRTSVHFGAPELSASKQVNFEKADVYSLGMTLLCAFYLCQPVDRNAVAQYNKKYQNSYRIMLAIQEMIMPIDKRRDIFTISKIIQRGQNSVNMKNFITSLRYKNAPKDKQLVARKKILSDGYQKLGLWNEWKTKQYQAYQLQQNSLDDYKKANSMFELAKIQYYRGQQASASQYAKSASKIYRGLGYTAYDNGNTNESLNLFTRAIECSKFYQNKYDIDTAKNLQGLALTHAEKGDYQLSKPLIQESTQIVLRNNGKDSIEYCKVKLSEAKIQYDFGNFQTSNSILNECLKISDNKSGLNQQLGKKLRAQILHQIGKNALKQSATSSERQAQLISHAEKNIGQAIQINQGFPNNYIALANDVDVFGQLQMRRKNYEEAKNTFLKAQQIRNQFTQVNPNSGLSFLKQKAQTVCNIAACENQMGNHSEALKSYNTGLEIYRKLYGSDHNKYSAITIGNMSKVYYKMNDKKKAGQCLRVASQILQQVQGEDDPDSEYFKALQQKLKL